MPRPRLSKTRLLAAGCFLGDAPGYPIAITMPGSYKITGNLDVRSLPNATTMEAVEIFASSVTLDLAGFLVVGPVVCSGNPPSCAPDAPSAGIHLFDDADAAAMRNEIVSGFGYGLYTNGPTDFARAENLVTWSNRLPGPGIAAVTFVIRGFVMVRLLGTRSFCRDVCPYGAVFSLADRFAPGRIVLAGACTACGRCTAVCDSGGQVPAEVARWGTVRSGDCLKDLDCVGVCPTGGLSYGWTRSPLLAAGRRRQTRSSRAARPRLRGRHAAPPMPLGAFAPASERQPRFRPGLS